MKQPSTLARKGPVRAVNLIEIRVFLYFSVLTFTWRTSRHNALARVSKSRVAGFRSDLSFRNRGYRIGRIQSRKKGTKGGDRATPKLRAMRNSPIGYKPTVPFRKTYGVQSCVFKQPARMNLKQIRVFRQSSYFESYTRRNETELLRTEKLSARDDFDVMRHSFFSTEQMRRASSYILMSRQVPMSRRKATNHSSNGLSPISCQPWFLTSNPVRSLRCSFVFTNSC
jgi:hypothetical protein